MCSAEPSLVEFIAPNEPRAFRRRHMAWDEGGAAPERGVAVACLLIAHPVSPRSRSVDYANRRICQEDITCTFVTRRRGRFGPYSWPTPPAPQQTKKPVPPPQLSKKQIEQQRRAKQAEQDRARAKAAAAAASPKTPVRPPVVLPPLPAAPKKTKSCLPPKFDKDALRRKQLEEDRALQEAIEAAEQVRKLARQCIVCRNNEGTMRCGVCQALICRDCAELGAIQKDSVFEAHLYQVPSLSDTIHLQNCARCHFPEDGVAFPIAMIEKMDGVSRSQGLSYRMECMTRGYFFVAESRIFPSENDVEAIINTRIKVTKARVPRSRFIAFMRRQIELLCWNWTKSDFDAELDEFLESESSSSADIPVANVPLVVSLTETHRRMLFVRRFLDEFCKEARLPIRLSFFEASSMPNPLGIRFRLNLDSLAPHLEAFADFCMRRNVDMPDDVFKRLPNFFGDKVRQFSRVPAHRLENEIVSHIYMNVGRWHFVSIVNRFVSDIIRGDVPLTVEAFRDWVREEKEVLDFREGAPKWEVHTIFRKRILPLCKARDEFNAIQREPPVRIKCLMPPSQPGRVVVAYVEGDVLEKNKAAFRALAKREQQ